MTNFTPTQQIGSKTAKNGFLNEYDIASKFNNWLKDIDAQAWIVLFGYNIDEVVDVVAKVISGYKADIDIRIMLDKGTQFRYEGVQVKLVSKKANYNQIDKRSVDKYKEMWNISSDIVSLLKLFTGGNPPIIFAPKDSRRMFINEFSVENQAKILNFFEQNIDRILTDVLKGHGEYIAKWIMVTHKEENNNTYIIRSIDDAIKHYRGDGKASISPRGSIKLGKVIIQRKGGTPDPTSLQFKVHPKELFEI